MAGRAMLPSGADARHAPLAARPVAAIDGVDQVGQLGVDQERRHRHLEHVLLVKVLVLLRHQRGKSVDGQPGGPHLAHDRQSNVAIGLNNHFPIQRRAGFRRFVPIGRRRQLDAEPVPDVELVGAGLFVRAAIDQVQHVIHAQTILADVLHAARIDVGPLRKGRRRTAAGERPLAEARRIARQSRCAGRRRSRRGNAAGPSRRSGAAPKDHARQRQAQGSGRQQRQPLGQHSVRWLLRRCEHGFVLLPDSL